MDPQDAFSSRRLDCVTKWKKGETMEPQRWLQNKALSRIMWFDYNSEGKGERRRAHMHLLTTSYFHCHEWGPHTDSPHFCQIVGAKTSHNTSSIQCWEKHFLGFAANRTLGEVCLWEHAELQRERARRDREAGCFSQKSRRVSDYLQSFMWSNGLFLSSAKLVSLLFLQICFVLLSITETLILLLVMKIDVSLKIKLSIICQNISREGPHEKCSVSMIVTKSISMKFKVTQNPIQTKGAQVFRIITGCVFITNENISENTVDAMSIFETVFHLTCCLRSVSDQEQRYLCLLSFPKAQTDE